MSKIRTKNGRTALTLMIYWYYKKKRTKDSRPTSNDKQLQTLIAFKLVGCDSSLAFKILLTISAVAEPSGTPLAGADMRVYKKTAHGILC